MSDSESFFPIIILYIIITTAAVKALKSAISPEDKAIFFTKIEIVPKAVIENIILSFASIINLLI